MVSPWARQVLRLLVADLVVLAGNAGGDGRGGGGRGRRRRRGTSNKRHQQPCCSQQESQGQQGPASASDSFVHRDHRQVAGGLRAGDSRSRGWLLLVAASHIVMLLSPRCHAPC